MQMLLPAVLIDALHPAFENAEIALNRVRVDLAAPVLALTVAHEVMSRELALQVLVLARFVRNDLRLTGDVGPQDRHNVLGAGPVHMEGAGLTRAADQR